VRGLVEEILVLEDVGLPPALRKNAHLRAWEAWEAREALEALEVWELRAVSEVAGVGVKLLRVGRGGGRWISDADACLCGRCA